MVNALIPELSGRRLTVDIALKQPQYIRSRIAKLTDDQTLLDKFYRAAGFKVESGGFLYNVIQASDFFTSDVEKRAPRGEYRIVEGVDPDPKLALVEDWGGKFQVAQEDITRNNVSYLDQQVTQISNTISRKLDVRGMAELTAAVTGANVVPGNDWSTLVTIGDPTTLTPSADLPTADLSAAQLASDLQELGVKHNLLVVHPNEAHSLRVAYGDKLDAMLKSAGIESMFSNPRVAAGTAWAVERGMVGTVGFEWPLTVDVWEDKATRSWWVQAFCVAAYAVDRPFAAKKLTGLAG
ncbi:major capsid protein [Mycobacterium paragordonae]|uniref:major capsid protein n=1 Tax=Mycobacterium paragordonae TaxID=1389713 RepID=UPI0012E23A87|nr:major capsid protein [Mycobacterium paragordonae]